MSTFTSADACSKPPAGRAHTNLYTPLPLPACRFSLLQPFRATHVPVATPKAPCCLYAAVSSWVGPVNPSYRTAPCCCHAGTSSSCTPWPTCPRTLLGCPRGDSPGPSSPNSWGYAGMQMGRTLPSLWATAYGVHNLGTLHGHLAFSGWSAHRGLLSAFGSHIPACVRGCTAQPAPSAGRPLRRARPCARVS